MAGRGGPRGSSGAFPAGGARERAVPARAEGGDLVSRAGGTADRIHRPDTGDLLAPGPEADGEPGQAGRAERGGFDATRTHHVGAEQIGLEAEQRLAAGRASVHAELA